MIQCYFVLPGLGAEADRQINGYKDGSIDRYVYKLTEKETGGRTELIGEWTDGRK